MRARWLSRNWLSITLPCLAGCMPLHETLPVASDAGVAWVVHARDARGDEAALDALPRRPVLVIEAPDAGAAEAAQAWLFAGGTTTALAEDLEAIPLRKDTLARSLDVQITRGGPELSVTPNATLARGERYTLVIDTGEEAPRVVALRVSDDAGAGAAWLHSLPAHGAAGVPPNLASATLALDGEVTGSLHGVWIEDGSGHAVPARAEQFPCAELDAAATRCISLVPDAGLAPLSAYTLRSGAELRDAHGAAVAPLSARFVTGAGADLTPPAPRTPGCAIDEITTAHACVRSDDRAATLRVASDDAVRFRVTRAGAPRAGLCTAGAVTLIEPIDAPTVALSLTLTLWDLAGNASMTSLELAPPSELPTVSITEVRADPRGTEPAQEFVELLNYGDEPIALAGFSLADSDSLAGSPLDTRAVLYPAARALLVSDAFDASDPADDPPAPGTTLVRVGPSLAKSGLANTGEALFLRDPQGRRVSAAPATPRPTPGGCIVRVSSDPRDGSDGSFAHSPDGLCTPGT